MTNNVARDIAEHADNYTLVNHIRYYERVVEDKNKEIATLNKEAEWLSKMLSLHDCAGNKRDTCPEHREIGVCDICWRIAAQEAV